jgi:pilus retraction protein PilT
MEFDNLMGLIEQEAHGKGYGYISDIYLQPERPPFLYVCKKWVVPSSRLLAPLQGFKVARDDIRKLLATCLERNTEKTEGIDRMGTQLQTDFAFDWETHDSGTAGSILTQQRKKTWRVRAHVSYNNLGQSLTLRLLTRDIPSVEDLNMPRQVKDLVNSRSGLILVCGPTGGGKSTTMASLVKAYAGTQHGHIATLEDPIEYVFDFPDRLVTQQMVGRHVESWSRGIYHALRDKVELLLIGEMRDQESVRAAIQAASAGHLVIASTHYTSATRVLNSLVNMFPPHEIETMKQSLLSCLIGVVCQNLVPGVSKGQPCVLPCYEIMHNTAEIRANLLQNSFNVIDGLLASSKSREHGNVRWRARLDELLSTGQIIKDVYDFYYDHESDLRM